MQPRAVIYARQSLDRSGEGAAIERQVQDCQALAEARGWVVVAVEEDNDVSASSGKARPGYERVLAMVERRAVDRVVVWAVDRLTRRMRDLEDVVDVCERNAVSVATVSGDIDLGTDMGRMVARILASVARGEVERKGTRQRRANLQRAQAGNVAWTRRPFGYKRVGGQVVIVDDEAEAIRAAATVVLDGATLAGVARGWNTAGLATTANAVHGCPDRTECGRPAVECPRARRGTWTTTGVRRVLLNPRYTGRAVYRGEDHGAGRWPTILEPATQEKLYDVLRDAKRRTQQTIEHKHLLSGLAHCGKCGSTMQGTPLSGGGGRRWQGYKCTGIGCYLARRADLVDEVVTAAVVARLRRPDAAALFTPDVDLDSLRAQAQDLRQRRDTLAELVADGLITATKARQSGRDVADRLRAVESSIEAAGASSPLSGLATAVDVLAAWEELDTRRRRSVVDALMKITILPSGKGVPFDPQHVCLEWRATS